MKSHQTNLGSRFQVSDDKPLDFNIHQPHPNTI